MRPVRRRRHRHARTRLPRQLERAACRFRKSPTRGSDTFRPARTGPNAAIAPRSKSPRVSDCARINLHGRRRPRNGRQSTAPPSRQTGRSPTDSDTGRPSSYSSEILSACAPGPCRAGRLYLADIEVVIAQTEGRENRRRYPSAHHGPPRQCRRQTTGSWPARPGSTTSPWHRRRRRQTRRPSPCARMPTLS